MAWTNVSKPGAQTYINVNTQGKEQYDQSTILYDDPSIFYDGSDPNQWTMVPKPVGGNQQITIQVGMATGLIMPPTYSVARTFDISSQWTKVPKPQ
jgi:hypothetical protein